MEHVTPIPGEQWHAYRDIKDWANHLQAFKIELEDNGLTISFYRPPGGLLTELVHFVDFVAKQNNQDVDSEKIARDIIDMINNDKMKSISELEVFKTFIEKERKDRQTPKPLSHPFNFSDPGQVVTSFIETIKTNKLKLWGSTLILSTNKDIAINWIGVQSWTSLIKPNGSNFVAWLKTGVKNFSPRFKSATDGSIKPFVVILSHDNNSEEYDALKKEIDAALKLPEFHKWRTLTRKEANKISKFCHKFELKFVTMSKLYEIVSKE